MTPADPPSAAGDLPDGPPPPRRPRRRRHWFLAVIAAYKLLKALTVIACAVLLLRIVHRDLMEVATEWIEFLGINPQGQFAHHLIVRMSRLNPSRLHIIVAVLFCYAVIYTTEGIGLFLEVRWAEWLTVVQTGLLLPWEAYELAHRPGWIRLAILLANVGVVVYLIWRIQRDNARERLHGS